MTVVFHMIVVGGVRFGQGFAGLAIGLALAQIQAAGIPVALARDGLRSPVGPDPEFRVAEPIRALIGYE